MRQWSLSRWVFDPSHLPETNGPKPELPVLSLPGSDAPIAPPPRGGRRLVATVFLTLVKKPGTKNGKILKSFEKCSKIKKSRFSNDLFLSTN